MKVNQPKKRWSLGIGVAMSLVTCVLALTFPSWGHGESPANGGSPSIPPSYSKASDLIHEAAQATEHAWEEFHAAAIGGTLASPAIQTRIEGQLHEVRALLMEARIAERANQLDLVKSLTQKILQINQTIVQASREKKQ